MKDTGGDGDVNIIPYSLHAPPPTSTKTWQKLEHITVLASVLTASAPVPAS